MKKVAINGFGRIGRAYFRLAHECKDIEVVAINDLMDLHNATYLLQYDSNYGTFPEQVSVDEKDDALVIGKKRIAWLSVKNPTELPWRTMDIDVVIEATGVFTSYEKAYTHIMGGAKHTIITAPVKDSPPENVIADTVLVGVNEEKVQSCTITSNASCTTNAVGIPLAVLNKSIGIESAILNTVHSQTATQQVVDGPSKKSDPRAGRAVTGNIIPSSTGAAIATTKALPALQGHFEGIALRIPTPVGSIADITFVARKHTTVKEVNEVLKNAENELFATTEEPIVSSDIVGERYTSVADLSLTRVVNGI